MCELVAMSARYPTNLTLSLQALTEHSNSGGHSDGWGVAYYNDRDAWRVRDTKAAYASPWAQLLSEKGFTSRLAIAHIRKATRGAVVLENTQPFEREMGGRIHVFTHNGDLPGVESVCQNANGRYRPVGETDSEEVFCQLMNRLDAAGAMTGSVDFETKWHIFRNLCDELRSLGPANFLYGDSEYLFVHGNRRTQNDCEVRPPGLHWLCRECRQESEAGFSSKAIATRDLPPDSPELQRVVIVASVPLSDEPWSALDEGETLAIRDGRLVARDVPGATGT